MKSTIQAIIKKVKLITKSRATEQDTRMIYNFSNYIQMEYDFDELKSIIRSNVYATRCASQLVESTTGKGYEASEKVKSLLSADLLKKIDSDFTIYGNAYIEVESIRGEVIALYYVPARSVRASSNLAENKEVKEYIQISGYSMQTVVTLPKFDPANIPTEKQNAIFHIMSYTDNVYYGSPAWISAKNVIECMNNSENYIADFFKNNAVPRGILVTVPSSESQKYDENGQVVESGNIETMENFLADNFRGVGNGHRCMVLELGDAGADVTKAVHYLKLNDNIVNADYLNMQDKLKSDICSIFGVPAQIVGIQTSGKLGGSSEIATQYQFYIDDVITPRQRFYESEFSKLLGETIKFNKPEYLKQEATQQQPEQITKSVNSDFLKLLEYIED